jgi:hypothetical protein
MPKSTLEKTQPCPSCESPVAEHLDFCHRCGETIARIIISQTRRPPLVLAAAGVVFVCLLLIMGVTIYDFVHQYGVPGGADVSQRAERYISDGKDESAINLLEESLKVKAEDKRAEQWRLMLDQALYSQGKKLGGEGRFRDAVTSLARMSSTSPRHEEVEKLISEYSDKGLTAVFGKQEEGDGGERETKPLSKMEKAVMTAVPGGQKRLPASHL